MAASFNKQSRYQKFVGVVPCGVKGNLVHTASAAARSLYLHMGFDPSPIDPDTLLRRLKDVQSALQSWPEEIT